MVCSTKQPHSADSSDKILLVGPVSKKHVRIRRVILACVAFSTSLTLILWLFSKTLLVVRHTPIEADAIVLLGGEISVRAPQAARLFKEGMAPNIIGAGVGGGEEFANHLRQLGVPESALLFEKSSLNTMENAEATVKILRKMGARRVILVTSWWHSRRAWRCFVHEAPEIEFLSAPASDGLEGVFPPLRQTYSLLLEYLKMVVYLFWHGVWPI